MNTVYPPGISVVCGVRNDAAGVHVMLQALTQQTQPADEIILVDNGSSQTERAALQAIVAESALPVRVIETTAKGLTAALIVGCQNARYATIARHDSGDVSSRDRLRQQYTAIQQGGVVAVSGQTAFCADSGIVLLQPEITQAALDKGLSSTDDESVHGPSHHGCVMFLRAAYEQVGGYQQSFYVAQDLDLWMRLHECGGHRVQAETQYYTSLNPKSISATRRELQQATKRIICLLAAERRQQYADESKQQDLLAQASMVSQQVMRSATSKELARGHHYVGGVTAARISQQPQLSKDQQRELLQQAQAQFWQALKWRCCRLLSWYRLLKLQTVRISWLWRRS